MVIFFVELRTTPVNYNFGMVHSYLEDLLEQTDLNFNNVMLNESLFIVLLSQGMPINFFGYCLMNE